MVAVDNPVIGLQLALINWSIYPIFMHRIFAYRLTQIIKKYEF